MRTYTVKLNDWELMVIEQAVEKYEPVDPLSKQALLDKLAKASHWTISHEPVRQQVDVRDTLSDEDADEVLEHHQNRPFA